MSCPRERELALYVEDDLPVSEIAGLQAHVLDCAACRTFLLSLEASQQALKALAAEPMADDALALLRQRAAHVPAVDRGSVRLRWAAAAAVVAALLPGLYLAVSRSHPATAPERAAIEKREHMGPAATPTPVPAIAATAPSVPAPVVHRRKGRQEGRSVQSAIDETLPELQLTADEADQLARALVAVSRVERLSDLDQEPAVMPETPLVRIATDVPDLVIYWRLEPSGGK